MLFGQRRSRSSLPVRIFAYIKPVETLSLRVRECSFLKRAPLPRPPPPSRRPRRRAPTPLALPHPRNAKRDSSRNGFTLRLARRASTHGGRRRWQWARPRRRCCSCSTWRPRNDRTLLTPFPHFYSPCSLTPPSSPFSSPLFIYGFTLFFVSLLSPPSTARAPLYWLCHTIVCTAHASAATRSVRSVPSGASARVRTSSRPPRRRAGLTQPSATPAAAFGRHEHAWPASLAGPCLPIWRTAAAQSVGSKTASERRPAADSRYASASAGTATRPVSSRSSNNPGRIPLSLCPLRVRSYVPARSGGGVNQWQCAPTPPPLSIDPIWGQGLGLLFFQARSARRRVLPASQCACDPSRGVRKVASSSTPKTPSRPICRSHGLLLSTTTNLGRRGGLGTNLGSPRSRASREARRAREGAWVRGSGGMGHGRPRARAAVAMVTTHSASYRHREASRHDTGTRSVRVL